MRGLPSVVSSDRRGGASPPALPEEEGGMSKCLGGVQGDGMYVCICVCVCMFMCLCMYVCVCVCMFVCG